MKYIDPFELLWKVYEVKQHLTLVKEFRLGDAVIRRISTELKDIAEFEVDVDGYSVCPAHISKSLEGAVRFALNASAAPPPMALPSDKNFYSRTQPVDDGPEKEFESVLDWQLRTGGKVKRRGKRRTKPSRPSKRVFYSEWMDQIIDTDANHVVSEASRKASSLGSILKNNPTAKKKSGDS